jgi:tetratricopeptide (TPR) repeat protein
MLTRTARLWVIGIAFILLFWTILSQVYEITAIIIVGIALLIWGYFREGTVVMAARKFHEKNYDEAEKLLKEIADPDRLGRHRRGFYEFIYGNIELRRHHYEEAEKHFQIASKFSLRNQNDKAIVMVHLANLNLRKKDPAKAEVYVQKAKTFRITARVKNIIQNIEQEIKLQRV